MLVRLFREGIRVQLRVKQSSFSSKVSLSLSQNYLKLVTQQKLKEDPQQLKLLKFLQTLQLYIETYDFTPFDTIYHERTTFLSLPPPKREQQQEQELEERTRKTLEGISRLRGLYIYGPVGSGKSMLMDFFYQSCQLQRKQRVHFHQFMLTVHQRIHQHKQSLLQQYGKDRHINLSSSHDSIRQVARQIAYEVKLLCFDEFQVTDIADAVIISRLFNELWSNGMILVATSNRPPSDLYLNGMNRKDFLPFLQQLEKECFIKELNHHGIDYRVSESIALQNTFFLSNSIETHQRLYSLYEQERKKFLELHLKVQVPLPEGVEILSDGTINIPVSFNRVLNIKKGDIQAGVCFLEFTAICEADRGASDYKALTKYFHSIYLINIPKLSKLSHNSARRFITFIDELYNHNIRLLFVADVPPDNLFDQTEDWEEIEQIKVPQLSEEVKTREDDATADATDQGRDKYGRNHEYNAAVERLSMGQQEEINVYESELASIKELGFAFQRATSRLIEMTSEHYFIRWKELYFPKEI